MGSRAQHRVSALVRPATSFPVLPQAIGQRRRDFAADGRSQEFFSSEVSAPVRLKLNETQRWLSPQLDSQKGGLSGSRLLTGLEPHSLN